MNRRQPDSPIPYILPLAVLLIGGLFDPRIPPASPADRDESGWESSSGSEVISENDRYFRERRAETARRFTVLYGLRIAVAFGLAIYFLPTFAPLFNKGFGAGAVLVGVAGFLLWVGLGNLQLEARFWNLVGLEQAVSRSAFNPFAAIEDDRMRFLFLGLRFAGLVIVVPLAEELFLRGFLMRWVQSAEWWKAGFARPALRALIAAPIYGALTHPAEIVAAVVWFSMVSVLVARTGRFLDAVVAHATTNLLLGIYICSFGAWQFW